MFWRNFSRRTFVQLNMPIFCTSRYSSTATTSEVKKLTIRNVFKDNPSAKYYLLTALTVTTGVTYYVYNNQQKKKFILNLLPKSPNHYTVSRSNELDKLKLHVETPGYGWKLNQVQISGLPGSGKTELARLLAENLSQIRKESFQFKIWPKDEVAVTLLAHSKESLLASLKQLASNLGCERENIKLENCDLEQQLDVFSQAVKQKLKQKKCWIMVVENHDQSMQLTKWLPDTDWGNGYVIHTINSENVGISESESQPNFALNEMTMDSAIQMFFGITSDITDDLENYRAPPEQLFNLLHYNPLSIACAAIYFNYKVQQNKSYSHEDLYTDIGCTIKQLQEVNPTSSMLQIIQTCSVTLVVKVLGERTPELLHVFDFLGSCNVSNPVPMTVFSHHLKTSEYHVQMRVDDTPEPVEANNEETSVSVNTSFEHEHNLWSFRGILDRAVKVYERIKLEVNTIKDLFGYGNAVFGNQSKATSDGLEVIRTCPLFIISHEPMADIEVVTVHPIVHNVLRQVFMNVTIPLLEQQHLVLAESKHQRKSYFGRLRSFDPQSSIVEYRRGLGDRALLKVDEGDGERNVGSKKAQPCVGRILSPNSDEDSISQAQSRNIFGHFQEHLSRVVNSLSNHYRIAGGDSSVMVARAMLLPHLETLLRERSLSAASKTQLYRTMANIHSEVFGDYASGKRLLNNAYTVCKERYGEDSLEIAGILTEQAELCGTTEELDQSKVLLERALEIYQKDIKTSQTNKQPFQYGKALVALGVTCGSLGETSRSKELLEKGLMELQNAAPNDPHAKENKWFAGEISSAVTSLGHAYLSLGKINQGRKLLELALVGHQNVHGDVHHEVIRTLTTLSIAHAMQGNGQESKRLRNEAGKIKKKLDMKSPLFLH